eukprot:CCRYP_000496-RA/>CCRYP_000496-RA protein AED:0.39 eAED:0.39 QI:0/-1/0/1/-1/1/1/0/87
MSYNLRGASPPISYYFLPRQRLNTLLAVHSISSFLIGAIGVPKSTNGSVILLRGKLQGNGSRPRPLAAVLFVDFRTGDHDLECAQDQ